MPRRPRAATGGMFFHVLNRAVGRERLFRKEADYAAFLRIIDEVQQRLPARLLVYCLMPNHWHLVLWPAGDGELSEFMRLLTVTHTQRWHAHHHSAGTGPLYQGRFKSFPIERDEHLLAVCRYVERNALRAKLADRAERWRWGSLWQRTNPGPVEGMPSLMSWEDCPVQRPAQWTEWVNRPQSTAEEAAIAESIRRGRPYGDAAWQRRTAAKLGLQSSLRPRGRPRVRPIKDSRPL
ncbi:MAG TPA: transposase [Tepidisphaeraceae bacterium]|nr:transposase [Tepidisphaeraceae bacterium]